MRSLRALTVAMVFVPCIVYAQAAAPPTPTDIKPGSITCEDVRVSASSRLPAAKACTVRTCGWPTWMPTGSRAAKRSNRCPFPTGLNFAGFYWGRPIRGAAQGGFRVVVPDQMGSADRRSDFIRTTSTTWRGTQLLLQHLKPRPRRDHRTLDGRDVAARGSPRKYRHVADGW